MKSNLDHLPKGKRAELAHVVEVVRAGFDFATARRTQPHLRAAKLLKIILFGSYARGDWVEDPVGRYFSDYDLLIVVNHDDLTDVAEFWEKTESRLLADISAGTQLRTPVGLIYHTEREAGARALFLHGHPQRWDCAVRGAGPSLRGAMAALSDASIAGDAGLL